MSSVRRLNRIRFRAVTSATMLISLLVGCTAHASPAEADPPFRITAWSPCPDTEAIGASSRLECASLTVPFDYRRPDAALFSIPLIRLPSTSPDPRLLITNPGGPGISGIADLRAGVDYFNAFTDLYTVVSFDPRGVGESVPAIKCLDEAQRLAIFDQPSVPAGEMETDRARTLARDIGQACAGLFADALPHVGTADVARDIDAIRAVLGFDRISYLGFSYGTFVGALYADLFPGRTDRVVLDSVLDPTLTYEQVRHDQAVGMQVSLDAFLADCLSRSDCPVDGSPAQALQQVLDVVQRLDRNPFTAPDGRTLSGARMLALIESSMYFPDSGWPSLRETLGHAVDGDLAAVTEAAYSSDLMVNPADSEYLSVVCIDFATRRDPFAPARLAPVWAGESPLSGAGRAWSLQPCESWPVGPDRMPAAVRASDSGPVLILNTTGDPATPLGWAESLHRQLDHSWLVIAAAQGHIAVNQSSCADEWATRFLREGTLPDTTVHTCPADD